VKVRLFREYVFPYNHYMMLRYTSQHFYLDLTPCVNCH